MTVSLLRSPGLCFSILADLNNAIVWMVSSRSSNSNSSSSLIKALVIVPSAPITIGITVTFMFHSFFILRQDISICVFFRFLWFSLCGPSEGKGLCSAGSFFCKLTLGFVFSLQSGDLFVSQNPKEFCVSHSRGQILVCAYKIWLYNQISISCTTPSGSPSLRICLVWYFLMIVFNIFLLFANYSPFLRFLVLSQDLCIWFHFNFLWFLFCNLPGPQSQLFVTFSLFSLC